MFIFGMLVVMIVVDQENLDQTQMLKKINKIEQTILNK